MELAMSDPALSKGFCRDCLAEAGAGGRCPICASPRLVRHPEIDSLAIAHVDCDAFYAAIEKRDSPALKDRPVIVGGGRRGVVATACYVARIDGVHSAMPMFRALQACPQATVIRPDMAKYAAVGREVRALMRELTPLVEPLSIDEAFLDLAGTERLHGTSPARMLARLARRIEDEIGITISVGLSCNKFLAKIASDLDKPRGFSVIGREEAPAFLKDRPVGLIWGVGKALQARLARDGLRTLGQIQRMEEHELVARYGAMGGRLFRLARGEDDRKITPDAPAKSISAETTFERDIADARELETRLWHLCEKVARRTKAAGLAGETAVLKLKTAEFRTLTRNRRLEAPTRLADRLYRALQPLLAREADGRAFRLIGAGLSGLLPAEAADPRSLFDPAGDKLAEVERAMDRLRARFGEHSLEKGIGFTPKRGRRGPED